MTPDNEKSRDETSNDGAEPPNKPEVADDPAEQVSAHASPQPGEEQPATTVEDARDRDLPDDDGSRFRDASADERRGLPDDDSDHRVTGDDRVRDQPYVSSKPPPSPSLVISHLFAGAAGGVLALLAGALAGDRLAPSPGRNETAALERRMETLEQAMPMPAPQVGEKIASFDTRLANLETEASRVATETPAAANAERLSKLETQLNDLSALATDPRANQTAEAANAQGEALKAETAQAAQTAAEAKDAADRGLQAAQAAQNDAATVKTSLAALSADIGQRFEGVAKSTDIAAALAPLASRVEAVEQTAQRVASSEENRRAQSERILLALELAGLKRAVERGEGYERELAEVRAASGGRWDLSALGASSGEGVPPLAELQKEFNAVSAAIVDAAANAPGASVLDRFVSGAKSIVRVRKTEYPPGDKSVDAVVARMDAHLRNGRLDLLIAESGDLPPASKEPAQAFLEKAQRRNAVDAAIAGIEDKLRSSLTN